MIWSVVAVAALQEAAGDFDLGALTKTKDPSVRGDESDAIRYANATVDGVEVGCLNCELDVFAAWVTHAPVPLPARTTASAKHPNAPNLRPSFLQRALATASSRVQEYSMPQREFDAMKPFFDLMWQERRLLLGSMTLHLQSSFVDVLMSLARRSPFASNGNCTDSLPKCGYSAGFHSASTEEVRRALSDVFDLSDGQQPTDTAAILKSKVHAALQQVKKAFTFYNSFCLPQASCTSVLLGRRRCADVHDECVYEEVRACPCTKGWFDYSRLHGVLGLLSVSRSRAGVLGQCEEFSRVAHALLSTLGFTTRYVLDFTDHVWVEVWIDGQWMHADPSEGVVDNPLMYERDWGKKLTMIFAFTPNLVAHVTQRYTANYTATVTRRKMDDITLDAFVHTANRRLEVELAPREWGIGFSEAVLWRHFN